MYFKNLDFVDSTQIPISVNNIHIFFLHNVRSKDFFLTFLNLFDEENRLTKRRNAKCKRNTY